MSKIIIDRTVDSKNKSSANRNKFIKRTKAQIKESVRDFITNDADLKSIKDGKNKKVKVSKKTIDEPQIVHSRDNDREQVYIGNKEYQPGDTVDKPLPPQGGNGSGNGEGEDDFYFTLTYEEFLDVFFDDLELPDMIKKNLLESTAETRKPAGYATDGPPPKLDLLRTMQNSIKRNFAIINSIDEEIEEIEKLLLEVLDHDQKVHLLTRLDELKFQKENIPFIQDLDLRYRKSEIVKQPTCKAVMFLLMDVSGSMTQWHKEMAKRFFLLLYLFLTRQYDSVDLVFIKYHSEAKEVDEQDFFYSNETGGTIVYKSLELTNKIIRQKYDPSLYNIYVSHVSDGDTGGLEEEEIVEEMEKLLPLIQYYAYVNVKPDIYHFFGGIQSPELLRIFKVLKDNIPEDLSKKLACTKIIDVKDIYAVFRSLFEKK